MRKKVLLYSLGFSVLAHVLLVTVSSPFNWSKEIENRVKNEKKEPIDQVIEIRQFYAEKKEELSRKAKEEKVSSLNLNIEQKVSETSKLINDEITYASYIRDLILNEIKIPPVAKEKRGKIAVRVAFVLNQEGEVLSLAIPPQFRSHYALYNQEALAAVKRASASFPPFPKNIKKSTQRFSFLLLFSA